MFYCTIYRSGGRTNMLTSNQWDKLRLDVAAALRKHKDAKWGALCDDDGFYVGRFRRPMTSYPKERPNKYLPDDKLLKPVK